MLDFVDRVLTRRAELQQLARETYDRAEIPPGMLDAIVAAELARPDARAALETHYGRTMPGQLAQQLLQETRLFPARIRLSRMPRLQRGLEQLFALVAAAGVQCPRALGAATPSGLVDGLSFGQVYAR